MLLLLFSRHLNLGFGTFVPPARLTSRQARYAVPLIRGTSALFSRHLNLGFGTFVPPARLTSRQARYAVTSALSSATDT